MAEKADLESPLIAPPAGRDEAKRGLRLIIGSLVRNACITVVFVAHIALGASERVTFRLMAVSMSPFYMVLHQLLAASHLVLLTPVACAQAHFDPSSNQLRRCPKHALLTMAILDTMHCLLALYAGGRVFGVSQVVLVQGTIPCTMILAALILRTRFEQVQICGAAVVLVAVVAGCTAPSGVSYAEEDSVDRALFAIASVFAALSAVYKRRRLMLQVIDCTYLNVWLAFFQFACGLVLGPVLFGLDSLRGVQYGSREIGPSADDDEVFAHSEILRNIDEGVRCLIWASDYPEAVCQHSSHRIVAWLLSSCLLALTSRAVMQMHSVPALYVAEVMIIPASVLAITQPWLMSLGHAAAERVSAHSTFLLCLVVAGHCIHHSSFVATTCSRYFAPSTTRGDESYLPSCSSSRSDRADAEPLPRPISPVKDPEVPEGAREAQAAQRP